jgi:aerobic-type carbon monoxide dehydrogenase small subunit (CoxS/CutS family)
VANEPLTVNLTVNDQARRVTVESATTLLDALREKLALTGTKKACESRRVRREMDHDLKPVPPHL